MHEFLMRYRNSVHSTTGKSPAEVVFGHKLRSRLDALAMHRPATADAALECVVKDNQFSQCKYYGGKRVVDFKVNDLVLVKMYSAQKNYWVKGTVIDQIGKSLYTIKLSDSDSIIKRHANQLLKLKGEEVSRDDLVTHPSTSSMDQTVTEMPAIILPPVQRNDVTPTQHDIAPVTVVPTEEERVLAPMIDATPIDQGSSHISTQHTEQQIGTSLGEGSVPPRSEQTEGYQAGPTSDSAGETADQFESPDSSPVAEPPPPRRNRNVVNYKQYF
ncbi:uncharacterized protein LOC134680377 [Cydia fagiglandana]|uniref:uncharacterized protein LOC134680377 n=1 Tax=Cydia fagiglandana TaxID=1458189 RepID=UPI002FEE5B8A